MIYPHDLANENKSEFFKVFDELYEHSPWVIEKSFENIKNDSKFNDLEEFHKILSSTVLIEGNDLQMSLIKAHPLLAGKQATNNELTDFSTDEQKSAGLNSCTDEEIKLFDELNKNYFDKFDFPYILAVKGRNKEEILKNFKSRLENSYEVEKKEALMQINQIALIRIKGIYDK